MDKNFIHIDELVRGKLSGLEGSEPSGSWDRMKELLDREMPSKPRGGAAPLWQRRWSLLAGLLLISALATGGYLALSDSPATRVAETGGLADPVKQETPDPKGKGKQSSEFLHVKSESEIADNQEVMSGHLEEGFNETGRREPKATTSSAVRVDRRSPGERQEAHRERIGAAEGLNAAPGTIAKASVPSASSLGAPRLVAKDGNTSNGLISKDIKEATERKSLGNPLPVEHRTNSRGSQEPVKAQPLAQKQGFASLSLSSGPEHFRIREQVSADLSIVEAEPVPRALRAEQQEETGSLLREAARLEDDPDEQWLLDTIQRVETRETLGPDGKWRRDTIDMGLAALHRKAEPASRTGSGESLPLALNTATEAEVPAEAKSGEHRAEEAGEWVPLANFRVKSRASKAHYRKYNLFEEMVRNAKFQMGRAKFYPGLVAGVHSSLSKYSLSGFHIGATGSLSLNEKWGIHTEIRYRHSFNGKVFQDDSYIGRLDTTNTQQGAMISYDSVSNQFQYSTVSRFELPLMVSYSMKRWLILAGGTLSYQMGVDAQDVSKTYNQHFYQGLGSLSMERRTPRISIQDFGPQWGAGALLGLGYQVSPAIRLDARYAHPLWNNAPSPGAERLSESIFHRPSVEINMHFRFSSQRFKPHRR